MGYELSMEDVLSDENLQDAMDSLRDKRDSNGVDGVKLSELGEYWTLNGEKIERELLCGDYTMGLVQQYEIVNPKGKRRTISLLNSIDRLIFRALYQKLDLFWNEIFSDYAYAYRKNKGVLAAVEQAATYMEQGNIWSAELDIQNFFDNIDHTILIRKIENQIEDERILNLIIGYLKCSVLNDHIIVQKNKGLLQGGPLSPLLSNFYLNEMDQYMEKKGYLFCRFGDNINIYTQSYENASFQLQDISEYLMQNEKLPLNESKTGVFKGSNRKFLGYRFENKKEKIFAQKENKAYRTIYRDWYTTGIQKVDRNYHLINEGILTKRDFTVLFENGEGKHYIPVEVTDSLYIYSNTIFTGNFFEFVNTTGLNVCLIDKYGEKIGSFVPQNSRKNIKTELKQLRLYDDEKERLILARKLEIASVSNIRANLRYYERRKDAEELGKVVKLLSEWIQQLNEAKDITQLMMIEARARQKYYSCFNWILENREFTFEKRTRRPPKDPLNAMISFGNTLLYQRIANEINRTSLDIRIGIVHAAGTRPESLNLDLADLFKPILVDRTIFTLINRRMLSAADFVEVENDGIYLSANAKRKFIREFERKIYQKIIIDGLERSYDFAIKREVQKLKRFIEVGEVYKPYKYV